jgi:phosphoglycolate phosphatase-like HAD superfamily hydrolase
MKLVIFDLDQTLVNLFAVHDKAYHRTMRAVFGIKACYKQLDYTGKRVPDLVREFALKKGIPSAVIDMNIDEAEKQYETHFFELSRNVKRHILPGVMKLVPAMAKKYKLAIVTGSLRHIAEAMLSESGLRKYFKIILTGEDADSKSLLVRKAIKKAGKVSEVWVIGDSSRDIDAGNANKTKTIGVMTGNHDRKTLSAAKPTHIFKDLSNTRKIIEAIG